MAELLVIEEGSNVTHVSLRGRLDGEGVETIETVFTAETAARRLPTIVDLAEVSFLASLGMGMLIRTAKSLHRHQAGMVLLGPQAPVERALRAAQIHEVIPIVRERAEALDALHVG